MEYYLEFSSATAKVVYDNKYQAKYIIHKNKNALILTDLEKNVLGTIKGLDSVLDTYEFQIPGSYSGHFVVLSYFASNFIYIPKLQMLIGGNTKKFTFSIRKGTKKIATTSPIYLKNGPHISVKIKDNNSVHLVILLIELFNQIGYINDHDSKRVRNKKGKSKIAFNNFSNKKSE
ncbi:hypothetical protein Q2T76_03285 [Lactobacillus sp. YT155]|uniref:hypothetical protein n=1 Tax=Lactobacillus sp. YT155 TaxID=3060955 RepID=UPI00265EBB36|nr:hypothetical protein [Lactobacillus sp. YT155]MDO1605076.1 hypothetical protein [Lactobacillus sp. YT155]